jgi:uncharacterized membrane protein
MARACVLALIAVLLFVVWAWQWWRTPTLLTAVWAAIASVPILLPVRGILRADRRTFAWATLCVVPYFTLSISESVVNTAARPWAYAVLALSVLIFFALIACLRLSKEAIKPRS